MNPHLDIRHFLLDIGYSFYVTSGLASGGCRSCDLTALMMLHASGHAPTSPHHHR
jgi:hypothetical protein